MTAYTTLQIERAFLIARSQIVGKDARSQLNVLFKELDEEAKDAKREYFRAYSRTHKKVKA